MEIAVATPASASPPENLHRIMEPLYSTKARGLGLGAWPSRGVILEKNKGTLRVTSEPGRGTTFTVRLAAALGEGDRQIDDTSEPRILVVDDDVDTCHNLSDILTDLGYHVDIAHEAPAALELVRRTATTSPCWT